MIEFSLRLFTLRVRQREENFDVTDELCDLTKNNDTTRGNEKNSHKIR